MHLTVLRVITGETQEYVRRNLAKSYNNLAKKLGATTLEVVPRRYCMV